MIADWLRRGRTAEAAPTAGDATPAQVTVGSIIKQFWAHAKKTYRKPDGSPTPYLGDVRYALRPLGAPVRINGRDGIRAAPTQGTKGMDDLEPSGKARRQFVSVKATTPLARKTVNGRISTVKAMYRWATEEQLVPGSVWHALTAVRGLRRGRSDARETLPVKVVPGCLVQPVLKHVSSPVAAMIKLQLLTAARPGELVKLRPCDFIIGDGLWTVILPEHKTAHRGKPRTLYFNVEAQAIINTFLPGRATTAPLFSPKEGAEERRD